MRSRVHQKAKKKRSKADRDAGSDKQASQPGGTEKGQGGGAKTGSKAGRYVPL